MKIPSICTAVSVPHAYYSKPAGGRLSEVVYASALLMRHTHEIDWLHQARPRGTGSMVLQTDHLIHPRMTNMSTLVRL